MNYLLKFDKMQEKIKIAIIGSTGYTGLKLIELLLDHPLAEIIYVSSEQFSSQKFSQVYPAFIDEFDLECRPYKEIENEALAKKNIDLIFFATPNGIALKSAYKFIEAGIDVIDLSADYRFKNLETHMKYYELERHERDIELVSNAIYGLSETNKSKIREAKKSSSKRGVLIANPGCYPTASSLSLIPFFDFNKKLKTKNKKEVFNLSNIIIDAKSGASGAGRKAQITNLYTEVNESFKAYNLAHKHRHNPEIEEFLSNYNDEKINLLFSPHLVPMSSGILTTSYLSLNLDTFNNLTGSTDKEFINTYIKKIFQDFYKDSFFVQILNDGTYPNTSWVKGTNKVQIQAEFDEESSRIISVAAIDNTVKGAAGQAIQNMNLLYQLDESLGLQQKARLI